MVHLLHILVAVPLSITFSSPTFLTSFHYNEGEEKTIELLFLARSTYPNVVCEYQMRLELLELSYESTSHESACCLSMHISSEQVLFIYILFVL